MNTADTDRPLIMGIINVTPDSFSGDGILAHEDYVARATAKAAQMIAQGADIIDVGGESSRPGSAPVSVEEEIRRVVPVISSIKNLGVTIAVDTAKAEVADQALLAGATILNDISALTAPHMAGVARHHNAMVVLMHNSSDAGAISHDTKIGGAYHSPIDADIIETVSRELSARAATAIAAGIAQNKIILDPGIGFGKTVEQNLSLIAHLDHLKILGFRLLAGVSRKSFIGHTLDLPVEDRLEGTAACVAACVLRGADIIRVHDVKFMSRIVKMATALRDA